MEISPKWNEKSVLFLELCAKQTCCEAFAA